jgi:hypothetical protein
MEGIVTSALAKAHVFVAAEARGLPPVRGTGDCTQLLCSGG